MLIFYVFLHSLDTNPTPAKRVCLENNTNAMEGEQNANDARENMQPVPEIDLIKSLEPFIKYIKWESTDADYFLKTIRGNNIMTQEHENLAMSNMLQSFLDTQPLVSTFVKHFNFKFI